MRMLWRAFDKTVNRKPLASAVDAVYGNSIDSWLEVIAKKGLVRKASGYLKKWIEPCRNEVLLLYPPTVCHLLCP
jgi:hypothetical protein